MHNTVAINNTKELRRTVTLKNIFKNYKINLLTENLIVFLMVLKKGLLLETL